MAVRTTPEQLKKDLAALIDPNLAAQIVDSYTSMQQRYYAGDWKPSELDGGQFCEAIARAMYQIDAGVVTYTLLPGKIAELLRSTSPSAPHLLDDKARDHFCRVLQTVYKFRNDRGVAHVSSTHIANYLDATLVVATVKWMLAEFLRLAWRRDPNEVAAIIESIMQLEHPLIHELDGKPLVLTNQLNTSEEILVLLQHSVSSSLLRTELKESIHKDQSTISKAITRLNMNKEIRISNTGEIVITPLGQKRVREEIFPKLASSNGNKGAANF